ncbi:hypothetical protein EU805_00945 [Salipiger sp. IMCC34102]|uniref:hypothetical protein n=1 Tax=Salipiger sp. IMCC34102 TaxID=2510647 RepID=UPI00101D4C75|nr:hypothetical protein [Salipiger sp. IMCC34102]RYH03970.1 hypothetical protein EU805_00945 [Salipiger sp. IMCC34102]
MFRRLLPVAFGVCAGPIAAQDACENIPYDTANCVRTLACVGDDGLYFDGKARGWDRGTVAGRLSDGIACDGTWDSSRGDGIGTARLACTDGTELGVTYRTIDNETGTVIGDGADSTGRDIRAWSGAQVLRFLTPEGGVSAELPCSPEEEILISQASLSLNDSWMNRASQ